MKPQHERILQYMNVHGSITPMEAFSALGITKLSTRIGEMIESGISIEKHREKGRNRYGEKVNYMKYTRGEPKMIYPYTASIFDSDAYGVDTDSPESAYEIIDNSLRAKDETAIKDAFNEWVKEMAEEHFNTAEWGDEEWEAWYEKVRWDIV